MLTIDSGRASKVCLRNPQNAFATRGFCECSLSIVGKDACYTKKSQEIVDLAVIHIILTANKSMQ